MWWKVTHTLVTHIYTKLAVSSLGNGRQTLDVVYVTFLLVIGCLCRVIFPFTASVNGDNFFFTFCSSWWWVFLFSDIKEKSSMIVNLCFTSIISQIPSPNFHGMKFISLVHDLNNWNWYYLSRTCCKINVFLPHRTATQ